MGSKWGFNFYHDDENLEGDSKNMTICKRFELIPYEKSQAFKASTLDYQQLTTTQQQEGQTPLGGP